MPDHTKGNCGSCPKTATQYRPPHYEDHIFSHLLKSYVDLSQAMATQTIAQGPLVKSCGYCQICNICVCLVLRLTSWWLCKQLYLSINWSYVKNIQVIFVLGIILTSRRAILMWYLLYFNAVLIALFNIYYFFTSVLYFVLVL